MSTWIVTLDAIRLLALGELLLLVLVVVLVTIEHRRRREDDQKIRENIDDLESIFRHQANQIEALESAVRELETRTGGPTYF